MNKLTLSGLVLASVLCMVSCTKTAPVANPNPIVGYWVGTYQFDNAAYLGSYFYGFSVFADSTVIQQGGGSNGVVYAGKGTWSLSKDSVFTATVSNVDLTTPSWTQHITAKYSSAAGTLSQGTWVYTAGGSQTGTFSLKRTRDN